MATAFETIMRGYQAGQGARLNRLASEAYTTAPDQQQALLGDIARIDAGAAQNVQQQFQQQEDRTGAQLRGFVNYVNNARKTGNPAAVNAALQQGAGLIQRITGKPAPTEWTPDMDAGWAQLEAKVAMTPGGADSARVHSTYVDGDGNRVAVLSDNTTKILGSNDTGATQQSITINGPDGRPAQYTFDRRTGNYVPAGASMPAQPAQGQAVTRFTGPDGMPVEIGNDVPDHVRQQILANPGAFQEVPDGTAATLPDNPVSQFSGGNQLRATQAVVPGPSAFVGQSPAERAAAEAAAKAGVELQVAPQIEAIRTQAEIDRARGVASVKTEQERAEATREKDLSFGLYDTAINQLVSGFDGAITFPGLGSLPALTERQQIAQGGVAAMAPILKQLFRVSGEGTFTDKDQALLMDMLPTRDDLPAARQAKLRALDAIVRTKLGQPPGQAPSSQPVRRARNPQTGQVIELRDGQWVPSR